MGVDILAMTDYFDLDSWRRESFNWLEKSFIEFPLPRLSDITKYFNLFDSEYNEFCDSKFYLSHMVTNDMWDTIQKGCPQQSEVWLHA